MEEMSDQSSVQAAEKDLPVESPSTEMKKEESSGQEREVTEKTTVSPSPHPPDASAAETDVSPPADASPPQKAMPTTFLSALNLKPADDETGGGSERTGSIATYN